MSHNIHNISELRDFVTNTIRLKLEKIDGVKREIVNLCERFPWPRVSFEKDAYFLYRVYKLYSDEIGDVNLCVDRYEIYIDVNINKPKLAENILNEFGLNSEDYNPDPLIEVLFFIKHAAEALEGLKNLIPRFEDEIKNASTLLEMIREVVSVLSVFKIFG